MIAEGANEISILQGQFYFILFFDEDKTMSILQWCIRNVTKKDKLLLKNPKPFYRIAIQDYV